MRRLAAAVAAALVVGACGARAASPSASGSIAVASVSSSASAAPSVVPTPTAAPTPFNVYAAATSTTIAPALRGLPARVYVPNERSNSVSVVDPKTYRVIATLNVGSMPEHVTPSWDMTRLYVNDAVLSEIDPKTGRLGPAVHVPMPYNLYYSPDGRYAIVVAEALGRLEVYDRATWKLAKAIPIPWRGVDHMDFSADGSYLMATTEYTGRLVKVDLGTLAVAGSVDLGGLPIDVKLSPDGTRFFVANQGRGGVSVVDPVAMREVAFIATGRGAHGFAYSRDTRTLFVTNRLAGSISAIDVATLTVRATWTIGGSPDMLTLSPDGTERWTGDRFGNTVRVIDTRTGAVTHRIVVGRAPHGLTYFPAPGRISLGHDGVYR